MQPCMKNSFIMKEESVNGTKKFKVWGKQLKNVKRDKNENWIIYNNFNGTIPSARIGSYKYVKYVNSSSRRSFA